MGIEEQFETKNFQNIVNYNRKIQAALDEASRNLAMKAAIFEMRYPTKIYQSAFYKVNRGLEKQIDIILNRLHKDIQANIQEGIVSNWDMANLKNNKMVGTWAEGIKLNKNLIAPSFNQLNLSALETFINRTEAGMNLSERVWNLTNGAKDQLELYLASGISIGESAAEMATEVKQYLNEPNRLFRRVRQDEKLVLSKAARGYHPGAGIYRSSYKNALRLAKNEINMAYRMSDHLRRQQLPFVTGIEVHLSASHPRLDMCFISPMYKVLTSKGWIPIYRIKENDLVLSHKGKFRRVTKKYKTTIHKVEMITIEYKCEYDNRAKSKKINSTENHPFLVNNKWIPAKDIKVGDKVKILAERCKWCGKLIPYYREYCSKSCMSKETIKKQWSNPKHRENVSKKAKKRCKGGIPSFKEWIESGKNVDNLINLKNQKKRLKNLKLAIKEQMKNGTHQFQRVDNLIRVNRKLAQNKYSTFIEKKMEWLLKQKGINYIHTYPFKRDVYYKNGDKRLYFIDFVLTDYKIAIECDGWYWHQDKEKDLKRQREIEDKGFTILRFTDNEIRKHLDSCSKEIDRVINNHSVSYEFMDVIIEKVKSWTTENKAPITRYNLEVEKDNSYIIKGFVVHNCDDLVGKYPKGFIFMTWHVGCLCYTTSIMLNKKDSLKFMKTGKIPKSKYISKIPKRATNWIKLNAKTIAGYKNTPYFIRDNFTTDFKLKNSVTQITMPKIGIAEPARPGFIPAKVTGREKQLMEIKEFNKKYADAKIEHCTAVDTKGNILLEKTGTYNHINFTAEEFNRMNADNMIFTHNHPSGSSFSGDDLNMLGAYKRGSELRAVGTKYEYSAKIIDSTKFPTKGSEVKNLYGLENSILQSKYQVIYEKERIRLINAGIDYDEAIRFATKMTSQKHTHEAMEAFAKKFGIEYKRWLNK